MHSNQTEAAQPAAELTGMLPIFFYIGGNSPNGTEIAQIITASPKQFLPAQLNNKF